MERNLTKVSSFLRNYKDFFIGTFLFFIGFVFRFQSTNRPLWVDEFSSLHQSWIIQTQGFNAFFNGLYYVERHNLLPHLFLIIADSFSSSIQILTLPFVMFGSLSIVVFYYLAKEFTSRETSFIASLFFALSYYLITWSQQLRAYPFLLFFSLLFSFNYLKAIQSHKTHQLFFNIPIVIITGVLGLMTHISFLFIIAAAGLHLIVVEKPKFNRLIVVLVPISLFFIFLPFIFFQYAWVSFQIQTLILSLVNNIWFYHSFLFNHHVLESVLGSIGLFILFLKRPKSASFFILQMSLIVFFFVFLFPPYNTRYLVAIFPYLYLGLAVSLNELTTVFSSKIPKKKVGLRRTAHSASLALVTLFVIVNTQNFVFTPQTYFSVNKDMRQIAVVDYDNVYQKINQKVQRSQCKVAVVDTWKDRAYYYMGYDYPDIFIFRWGSDTGQLTNGLPQHTEYSLNEQGEKILPMTGMLSLRLVSELDDLHLVMNQYKYGFIFIDDTSLPQDVQAFVKENMYHELSIDSYGPELLENPYSRWPATLYSWGFETENPYFIDSIESQPDY